MKKFLSFSKLLSRRILIVTFFTTIIVALCVVAFVTKGVIRMTDAYFQGQVKACNESVSKLLGHVDQDSFYQYMRRIDGEINKTFSNEDAIGEDYQNMRAYCLVLDSVGNFIYHPDRQRIGQLVPKALIDRMTQAVHDFVGDAEQSDDLTMLYIRFMNNQISEETERHLILHNDIQQIPQLAEFVEAVADVAHLDVGLTMSLNLALEEAVSNVIMYAYPKGSDGLVDIEAIIRKGELDFIISDNGTPFDPTAAPEADITLDVEDRPVGGLGIFLMKNIMDVVKYTRSDDGKNILSMIKKLA